MKFFVIAILIILLMIGCNNQQGEQQKTNDTTLVKPDKTGSESPVNSHNPGSLTNVYANEAFNISLQYPASWEVKENDVYSGTAITVYPKNMKEKINLPLDIHADADLSYIAIWPGGIGTEFPSGETKTFSNSRSLPSMSFATDREQSKVFLLNTGDPWAYYMIPRTKPANWKPHGFIFAQVQTNNFNATCFDKETGKEKPMDQCDPLTGDRFVRSGKLNANHQSTIFNILNSIQLK